MTSTQLIPSRIGDAEKAGAKVDHFVAVKIDAVDPSDGYPYRDYVVSATSHDFTLAWWLGSPRVTQVISPCPCGRDDITVTARS